jgi:hypothetical protein
MFPLRVTTVRRSWPSLNAACFTRSDNKFYVLSELAVAVPPFLIMIPEAALCNSSVKLPPRHLLSFDTK